MSPRLCRSDLALFALLALLTVLGFQFAMGQQTEQLSLVLRLLDPGFIDQDFYTNRASEFGPRYYYVHLVAFLASFWPLSAVLLLLTLIVNFSLAAISYLAARDLLGADRIAGQIAAVLVVASSSFSLGLAPYIRFDNFQPASIAIPISLLALWCGMRNRPIAAAALAGSASAFHPLIGLEGGALALGCSGVVLALGPRSASLRRIGAWLAGILLLGASAFWLWIAPLPKGPEGALTNDEFYQLIAVFRAPHHYLPSVMPRAQYLTFAAYLSSLLAIYWHWQVKRGLTQHGPAVGYGPSVAPLVILAPVLVIILLCSFSYIFVEIAHSRLWITAQPFRLLYVVKWIGFLLIAWMASKLLRSPDPVGRGIAISMLLGTAEAQPLTVLLGLSATLLLAKARGRLPDHAGWVVLGGLALATGALTWRAGSTIDLVRISVGLICVSFLARDQVPFARAVVWPGLLVAGLVLMAVLNRSYQWVDLEGLQPAFTLEDQQRPDADIARWARDATPKDSIWLVPPGFRGFRIIAERAIVVDFTSFPFDDGAMREWKERMATSYGEVEGGGFLALGRMQRNHRQLTLERAVEVSERFGATFAVLYRETDWAGPVLHANEAFKVVRLPR